MAMNQAKHRPKTNAIPCCWQGNRAAVFALWIRICYEKHVFLRKFKISCPL